MNTLCSNTCNESYTYTDNTTSHATRVVSVKAPVANVSSWLLAPVRFVKTRIRQRIERQAFDNLLRLDNQMLSDIGVTRADVVWASNLPLSQDAATQLEIIARRR